MEKMDSGDEGLPAPPAKRGDVIVVRRSGSVSNLPEGTYLVLEYRVEQVLDSVTLDFYDVLSSTGEVIVVFVGNLIRGLNDGFATIVPG